MRVLKHLFAPSARRLFPEARLQRITDAIAAGELRHGGEICFAVEAALPASAVLAGRQARERAGEIFSQLRVWDTEANNGVLLYLLLADHRIEIIADRGFRDRVSAEQWRGVCKLIEERLHADDPEAAVVGGIEALSTLVAKHFPRRRDEVDDNELPDAPHVF
ncbi:MAG: TPM domain-containing protein [Lysobacter sp.]